VAKKKKAVKRARKSWSRAEVAELRRHSKSKTPVAKLERVFKRTAATLRQKAYSLGLALGHQRRRKKRA
jgi:hypothetical protein